jgi:hypothetical protein
MSTTVNFVAVTTGTTAKEQFSQYPCAVIIGRIDELLRLAGSNPRLPLRPLMRLALVHPKTT